MGSCQSGCSDASTPGDAPMREVKVVVFGLDNSGKSTLLANLNGDSTDDMTPTIGFSSVKMTLDNCAVTLYDVGGGPRIRGIWKNYFSEAYGIIYVVDSSSQERFTEAKNALNEVMQHEKVVGKPLLVFANKQDQDDASDDSEIANQFDLDQILGDNRQHSTVMKCTASKRASGNKSDPSLRRGLSWLLQSVVDRYLELSERVRLDVTAQREREAEERRQRMERVRKIREERERQRALSGGPDGEDAVDGGEQALANPFRPISQVADEVAKREQLAKAARKKETELSTPVSVAESTTNEITEVPDSRREDSAYASPGPSVPALKRLSQSTLSQTSSGLSDSDLESLTDVTPRSHGSSDTLHLSTSLNSSTLAADMGTLSSDQQRSDSASPTVVNRRGGRLEPLKSKKEKKKKQKQLLLSRLKKRNKTAPALSHPSSDSNTHHPLVSRDTWTGAELEPVVSPLGERCETPHEEEDPLEGLPGLPQVKRVLPPIKISRQQAGMGHKTFHTAEDVTVVPQGAIVQVSFPPPLPTTSTVEPLCT